MGDFAAADVVLAFNPFLAKEGKRCEYWVVISWRN